MIPARELTFTFSRSSKPGGQNVNKVNTRVTLWFDLKNSPSLSGEAKVRIGQQLATRIDRAGQLRVVSYRYRTQGANRKAAVERFVELLAEALHEALPRRKTRQPRRAKEQRLANKKIRSRVKQSRRPKTDWQD